MQRAKTVLSTPKSRNFSVARMARFGRAPRVLPRSVDTGRPARVRSDIEKDFESSFTRMGHLQRYKAVRQVIKHLGDVTERVCRNYATFSDSHGNQFAVVKPLSDGGLRIGVGDHEDASIALLDPASGLGSSERINHQFELESYQVLSGQQIGHLRRAYEATNELS